MAYNPYSRRARNAQMAPWYQVPTVLRVVRACRQIDYSSLESRRQALEQLNSSVMERPPYEAARRFPADQDFICEIHGDWARKFEQLRSALQSRAQPSGKDDNQQKNADENFGMAATAFHNATTAIYDQISRLDGILDRDTFEREYECTWA